MRGRCSFVSWTSRSPTWPARASLPRGNRVPPRSGAAGRAASAQPRDPGPAVILNPSDTTDGTGARLTSDDVRASDDEREAAVGRLQRALVDGRLSYAEFDDRVEAAYVARTRGDLAELTRDLPESLW
jgi:hypothetical protein